MLLHTHQYEIMANEITKEIPLGIIDAKHALSEKVFCNMIIAGCRSRIGRQINPRAWQSRRLSAHVSANQMPGSWLGMSQLPRATKARSISASAVLAFAFPAWVFGGDAPAPLPCLRSARLSRPRELGSFRIHRDSKATRKLALAGFREVGAFVRPVVARCVL